MLALCGRHVPEYAVGGTHLLFAPGIHATELLGRAANGLTAIRAQALHVLDAAERALALLRRHGIELMETVDEPLLLGLRQAVEAGLATQCVLLANKGFPLMILEPASEVRAIHI